MLRPAEIPLPSVSSDDLRIGHLIRGAPVRGQTRVVLVGFPSDQGVRRNRGRAGAAEGPDAIRTAFFRMTADPVDPVSHVGLLQSACDLGNLETTEDLERDQEELGRVLSPWLKDGLVAVVLGGGHETAFGHFLGYAGAGLAVDWLNWDAHPDVREPESGQGHSGSPFRQILLHPSRACRGYTVAGLIRSSVAKAHLDFVHDHGGRVHWGESLTRGTINGIYQALPGAAAVSFDLDAVDGAFAPGVSAPAVGGLATAVWLEAAYQAGLSAAVRSIDIVELNPLLDRDNQTAKLAAATLWWFLKGLSERAHTSAS
jgi:formiminoglutamase